MVETVTANLVISIVIALIGILTGVILVLIGQLLSPVARIAEQVKKIQETVDHVERSSQDLPSHFLGIFMKDAKFLEKCYIKRADKILIASKIASKPIENDHKIIIDSGTTVDQIPYMLLQNGIRAEIYTNNLLAAIAVIPPVRGFACNLLPGRIDTKYGATFVDDPAQPLRDIEAKWIIMAATGMSFEQGPMVDPGDRHNRLFKIGLAEKALEIGTEPVLIIAFDWDKFMLAKELQPVLPKETWNDVKTNPDFIVVTTEPPEALETESANHARHEIELFNNNMNTGGMKVEVCHESLP